MQCLRKEMQQCQEEVTSLRECLEVNGLVSRVSFLIQLHRRNFNTMCAQHGLASPASLEELIDVRAVTMTIGQFAGPSTLRVLKSACRAMVPAANDIVGSLCPGEIYLCGGFEGHLALGSVERFCPAKGSWEVLPSMKENRQYTCAGALKGKIYVCGGWAGPLPSRTVERFDPATTTWEQMPRMLVARWGAAACIMGNSLHICGGLDEQRNPLNSVERFDPAAEASPMASSSTAEPNEPLAHLALGAWEVAPPMKERRGWPAVTMLEGRLYVCGGRDEQREPLNSAETLRSNSFSWDLLPPMALQRAGAAAAAAGAKVYVVGGAFGPQMLNSMERFDPAVQSWEEMPAMSTRRAYVCAAALAEKLYIFGGSDGGHCLTSCELFDPATGTWTRLPDMMERRSGAGAARLLF